MRMERIMYPSSDLRWRTSSFSGTEVNCVEVAPLPVGVAVRDSKFTAGPTLAFPTATWRSFIEARS
jgi:hypothetical protein